MLIDPKHLRDFIADSGLVTRSQLENAESEASERGTDLGQVLVEQGALSEDSLRKIEAHLLGVAYIDLKEEKIPLEVLSLIPEPISRTHNIIAFSKNEGSLEVAMLRIADLHVIDFLKKQLNVKILPRLTSVASIKALMLEYQKALKKHFGESIQKEALSGGNTDVSAMKVIDTLLSHARLQSAAVIHIEPSISEIMVRYRINGTLYEAMVLPKSLESSFVERIKELSRQKSDTMPFRATILPTYMGEKVVLHLSYQGSQEATLESLGFHGDGLEQVHGAMSELDGVIIVAGPAKNGITTTLYTLLENLNSPQVSIVTLEERIKRRLARITQLQVTSASGQAFASDIRAILRQDPDIVMVSRIKEPEVLSLAVHASIAGRLVISSLELEEGGALSALRKLMDMKVSPLFLASTLKIVVGQRLVRRLAPSSEKYYLLKSEIAALGRVANLDRVLMTLKAENVVGKGATWDKIPLYKALPTEEHDGYVGNVGLFEILRITSPIRELIIHNSPVAEIELEARRQGMLTMLEDGIYKCVQGITTLEQVLDVAR